MGLFVYGTTTIEWVFQVEPGLKRHYITVERGRPVLLRGRAIPEAEQRQLIRQRARWIRERLKEVNQPCKETFVTGSRILYRGKSWYCQVQPAAELSKPVIRFANSRFFIQSPQGDSISRTALKPALEVFYRDKAQEKLLPRVRHWQRACRRFRPGCSSSKAGGPVVPMIISLSFTPAVWSWPRRCWIM